MKKPKNILLTGAGGMLGLRLLPQLKARFKGAAIYAVFHAPENSATEVFDCSAVGDLTDSAFRRAVIENSAPDLIINLAALTDVERCEREPEFAAAVNTAVVSELLELSPGSRFVQLSTDYVFDGGQGDYKVSDPANPLSEYGQTKLRAERLVLQTKENLVIRTAGVFDWLDEKNLFGYFLRELAEGRKVNALADYFYSPIWAEDLARGVVGLIAAGASKIHHYGGPVRADRLQFAQSMAGVFQFNADLIHPQTLDGFNWRAARPVDSSLNSEPSYKIAKVAPKPLALAFAEIQLQLSARAEALPD